MKRLLDRIACLFRGHTPEGETRVADSKGKRIDLLRVEDKDGNLLHMLRRVEQRCSRCGRWVS